MQVATKIKKNYLVLDEPQDLGGVSESDVASVEQIQKTQSVESVGTVITEDSRKSRKNSYQIVLQKNNMNLQ